MPIAAVPNYLQRQIAGPALQLASPALRFGLLLPIWTSENDQREEVKRKAAGKSKEAAQLRNLLKQKGIDAVVHQLISSDQLQRIWTKNEPCAGEALQKVTSLSESDTARMHALAARQRSLARMVPPQRLLQLEAVATAPFATGLGNEHPLENGFAFLNPYGLPYLAGSGVKGVIRQASRELASGAFGDTHGWDSSPRYKLPISPQQGREAVLLSMLDVLFGRETEEGEQEHFRGVLTFWDVIPEISGDRLLVEIMTPHQSHYYQQKPDAGSITPHDSGQPNPICFLTVPPGSKFVFYVDCHRMQLERIAPDLLENERWRGLISAAFEHAFRWLGFGAKTAVGYGAMKPATIPSPKAASATERREVTSSDSAKTVWQGATLRFDAGQQSVRATHGKLSTAPLRGKELEAFFEKLGSDRVHELKNKKSLAGVDVEIETVGNMIRLAGVAH